MSDPSPAIDPIEIIPFSGEDSEQEVNPWAIPPIPTTLIVFMQQEIEADDAERKLNECCNGNLRILDRPSTPDPEVKWCLVADIPDLDQPLLVWLESAQPFPPEAPVPDPVRICPWAVAVQTMLSTAKPLPHFGRIMSLLSRSFADSPGILDVSANRLHDRAALTDLFLGGFDPPPGSLWLIHSVPDSDDRRHWLFTDGLHRCGRPELEMLDIRSDHKASAARVLNRVAGMLIEQSMKPTPGITMEIGPELMITLQQAGEVARYVDESAPGSIASRTGEELTAISRRAAICAASPRGKYRKVWTAPHEVLRAIDAGETALYQSADVTRRRHAKVQATWQEFRQIEQLLRERTLTNQSDGQVRIAVKAAFAETDQDKATSHIWLDLLSINDDVIHARPDHTPLGVPVPANATGKDQGNITLQPQQVCDWVVSTPAGDFGPSQIDALRRWLDGQWDQAGSEPPPSSRPPSEGGGIL